MIQNIVLDHIAIPITNLDNVVTARAIHDIDNVSDHEPVQCSIKVTIIPDENIESTESESPDKPRILWSDASESDKHKYKLKLDELLSQISLPSTVICCEDVKCASVNCRTETTSYAEAVFSAIESAGVQTLPMKVTKPKTKMKTDIIPGWMELVKPQKETAAFWHSVWVSSGLS